MTLGQRVAVMRDGRILQVRHARTELYAAAERPLHRGVHRLAGDEPRRGDARRRRRPLRAVPRARSPRPSPRPASRSSSASGPRASRTRRSPAACRRSTSRSRCVEDLGSDDHVFFHVDAPPITAEVLESAAEEGFLTADRALFTARVDARRGRRVGRRVALGVDAGALPLLRSGHRRAARPAEPTAGARRGDRTAMTKQRETRERVLELIEALGVGDAIPSERQLGVDLGVSRLTVRAALDELVREGYLVRRRGAGHVRRRAEGREGHRHHLVQRRHARARAHAGEPHARPADDPGGRAPRPHPARLAVRAGRRREAAAARRRRADGDRAAARARVARSRAHRRADLEENSFYDLLASRWDVAIVGGTQTVEPTVTNDEESAALGVPLHSPALLFERVTRAATRRRGRVHELDLPRRPLPPRHRDRGRRPGAPAGGRHRTRPVGKLVLTFR